MMERMPTFGIDQVAVPIKVPKLEPWMAEFVKGRHHQEEWDAFFVYCEASPFRRGLIRLGWLFHALLIGR